MIETLPGGSQASFVLVLAGPFSSSWPAAAPRIDWPDALDYWKIPAAAPIIDAETGKLVDASKISPVWVFSLTGSNAASECSSCSLCATCKPRGTSRQSSGRMGSGGRPARQTCLPKWPGGRQQDRRQFAGSRWHLGATHRIPHVRQSTGCCPRMAPPPDVALRI